MIKVKKNKTKEDGTKLSDNDVEVIGPDEVGVSAAELMKDREQLEVVIDVLDNGILEIISTDPNYSAKENLQRWKNDLRSKEALEKSVSAISKVTSEIKTQTMVVDKGLDKAAIKPTQNTDSKENQSASSTAAHSSNPAGNNQKPRRK